MAALAEGDLESAERQPLRLRQFVTFEDGSYRFILEILREKSCELSRLLEVLGPIPLCAIVPLSTRAEGVFLLALETPRTCRFF